MKPISDKRRRTEYKRPATIGSIPVRRTGISDIYMLTPGGQITVNVDKQGGAYTGAVIYTTDSNPGKFSTWAGASADDAADVSGAQIPAEATAVAFACSVVTGTIAPRVPAQVAIRDSNVDDNRTINNRVRHYSGGHVAPAFTAFIAPPPGQPLLHYDFNDISTLWTDTGGTAQVANADDPIARIDSKGTNTTPLLQGTLGNRPLYKTNYGGSCFAADGDTRWLTANFSGLGAIAAPYTGVMVWAELPADGGGFPFTLDSGTIMRVTTSGAAGSTTWLAGGSSSTTSYAGQNVGVAGGYGICTLDLTSDNARTRMPTLDGDSTSTFGSAASIPDPFDFTLGASDEIGGSPFEGYLIECIFYGTGHSINYDTGPVTYQSIKDYMFDRYGFVNP